MELEAVFLARHGQTEWNVERRRQGRLDSPLTPAGRDHARQSAHLLRGHQVDGILASPVGRSLTTARMIGDGLGLGVEVVDDLAELDHGEFSGLVDAEIDARFPGERERRAADKYRWRFPGGESYELADARAARALGRVRDRPFRRPLLVSHEMIGRMLLRNLLDLDPQVAVRWPHPHGVVFQVDPRERSCSEVR